MGEGERGGANAGGNRAGVGRACRINRFRAQTSQATYENIYIYIYVVAPSFGRVSTDPTNRRFQTLHQVKRTQISTETDLDNNNPHIDV